jgi:iron complex outermembrane receptor protein
MTARLTRAWLLPTCWAWLATIAHAQSAPEPSPPTQSPPAAEAPSAPTPPAAAAPAPAPTPAPAPGPEAAPGPASTPPGAATTGPRLEPPRLRSSTPPEYPLERLAEGLHPTVVLHVTLKADGSVVDVHVEHSAGEDFDAAAVAAVRGWSFEPAKRDGTPVAAQVRVAVHFDLPVFELDASATAGVPTQAQNVVTIEAMPQGSPEFGAHAEVALPDARTEARSASHYTIERDVLAAAPRREGAELLLSAPGLFAARSEGDAVAQRITLRGFDADHGQDLELRAGGLPINLPSHIHGQGYADMGFLIAEVVDEMRVTEGVYDPRQGDFAVAGSIDFELGVRERGVQLRSSYGSFNTFRMLGIYAPKEGETGTFGAAQVRSSDGFGDNRQSLAATAIGQGVWGKRSFQHRLLAIAYGVRADSAGVLRADDVAADRVGFEGVYPYPTAQAQNGLGERFMLGYTASYRGADGDTGELGAWLGYDDFRLQRNFTGFIERSRTLEDVSGRGDLIEQQNRTTSYGLSGRYRTAPFEPASWARGTLELGLMGRLDVIEQAQNLIDATVRNQTWDRRIDAGIDALDVGMWGDLDWAFTKYLALRAGMRADVLFYDVEDRLGNFAELSRPEDSYIAGFRRSAAGVAWGPRTSAEVKPLPWLAVLVAYGEGFRSPQARLLEDGEQAPFTKVRSGDLGVRLTRDTRYELKATGFYTWLSDDVAFDASEGSLARVGSSRRLGATLYGRAKPWRWLTAAGSVTFVDAILLEPPPPTAEEPQPPFSEGQNLPYVPPVVLRLDLGTRHTLVDHWGAHPLTGRLGAGFSYLSPRPLPYGEHSDPVGLLDASAGLGWGPIELGVELFNLLDARYAAVEYNFASQWDPDAPRSRLPERHTAAGQPLTVLGTLGVTL